jgi:hypothetical protein
MEMSRCLLPLLPVVLFLSLENSMLGQEPAVPDKEPTQQERIKELEKTLTGARLTGRFTIRGKEDAAPAAEEYTITSATKLPEGDLWLIKARIKYGQTDGVYPIPLEIKWAGDTPVITLTRITIPGLGTFSSRVVIYEGLYAGTWQHGDVSGHLFGTLSRAEEQADPSDKPDKTKDTSNK